MAVRYCLFISGLAAALAVAAAPALADPVSDLDVLAEASGDPQLGIQLARDQIGEGDLIGAVATLERLLIRFPATDEALLLHAGLLCRLDDRAGAQAELAAYGRVRITDQAWSEVTAACGPAVRRPGAKGD